ncbi:LPS export ABC transporter periplasmic protein LptC [Maribellus comscasis]|uniref:LPS export ABC transporter periplasmic protein LptC n=1 Tax=Maribellus comscasis TaxID=2681766 RepID=A0A6I6JTY1_9BACT|nr:LPS export ABC transporter periplasmic protein LptC [Maribellus comscasis]QGY43612.1 LPS export ABC transporter periplasmic protein LptC [Maribellus comscasis]
MNRQKLGFKIKQQIRSLGIAALFMGAAILFFACEKNNLEEIKAFSSAEDLPVLEASDFETIDTDSGVIRYELKAPKLLQFETEKNSYSEFPEGVELTEYDANRKIVFSITANYAKQFLEEDKWEAKNNVIATNAQGDTLKTEHLIYEEKEGRIYTEEFVRIIRPDQTYTGVGFESDQALGNWKIKDLKGTVFVSTENTENTENNIPQENDSGNDSDNPSGQKKLEFN